MNAKDKFGAAIDAWYAGLHDASNGKPAMAPTVWAAFAKEYLAGHRAHHATCSPGTYESLGKEGWWE